MVPILLVVGEITPKTLAIRNNVAFATVQSRPIDVLARLITPLRWLVRTVSDWFITLVVGSERSPGNIVTEDLKDEYDVKEPDKDLFHKLGERDYLTSGRTELGQLSENLGVELPSGGYSTIAGFILHATGSIPAQGTRIEEGAITLTVHRGSARAIQDVRIRWTE